MSEENEFKLVEEDLSVQCNCHHPMHQVVFRAERGYRETPELWIFNQLNPYLPTWKRFLHGIKFAFGIGISDPSWAETQIDHKQILKIRDFMGRLAESSTKHEDIRVKETFQQLADQNRRLESFKKLKDSLYNWTKTLEHHPEGYKGPCSCKDCSDRKRKEM